MFNYIRADILRILRRIPHAILMVIVYLVYIFALMLAVSSTQVNAVSMVMSATGFIPYVAIFIGIFELIAVFSEDFKVKTMQVAIGMGLTRTQVVFCKLFELIFLLILNFFALIVSTFALGAYLGVTPQATATMDLLRSLLCNVIISNIAYASITMIVLFFTQSTLLSIFAYAFVGMSIVSGLYSLSSLLNMQWLTNLRLDRFMLSRLLTTFEARLQLNIISWQSLLGILIHIAVGLAVTCNLFKKRELEF